MTVNPCQAYNIDLALEQKGTSALIVAHEYYPCIMYRTQVNAQELFFTVESMHAGPYSSVTYIETIECKLAFDCKKGEKVFYKLKKDCSCYKDKLRYAVIRLSWTNVVWLVFVVI